MRKNYDKLPGGWSIHTGFEPVALLETSRRQLSVIARNEDGFYAGKIVSFRRYNIVKMSDEKLQELYTNLTQKLIRKLTRKIIVDRRLDRAEEHLNLRFCSKKQNG